MGNRSGKIVEPEIIFESPDEDEKEEEEEEPLDLALIPHEILWLIIEKLDYTEYGRLRETGCFMDSVCQTKEFRLECQFPQIIINQDEIQLCKKYEYEEDHIEGREPVVWKDLDPTASIDTRLAVFKIPFTSDDFAKLTKLFEVNATKIDKIRFEDRVLCKPEELLKLIKQVQVGFLDCQQFLRAEYFNEEIMNLRSLNMINCNFDDRRLAQWNGENLFIQNDTISDRAINGLLKKWKAGQLDFMTIDIEFDTTAGQRDFDVLLDGLDANPIWTPALHDFSAISRVPIANFDNFASGDPEHLYSMWRPTDIEDIKIVRISERRIDVMTYSYELDYLYGYLSEDQYLQVEMCNCGNAYCVHKFMLQGNRESAVKKFAREVLNHVIIVFSSGLYIRRLWNTVVMWK